MPPPAEQVWSAPGHSMQLTITNLLLVTPPARLLGRVMNARRAAAGAKLSSASRGRSQIGAIGGALLLEGQERKERKNEVGVGRRRTQQPPGENVPRRRRGDYRRHMFQARAKHLFSTRILWLNIAHFQAKAKTCFSTRFLQLSIANFQAGAEN